MRSTSLTLSGVITAASLFTYAPPASACVGSTCSGITGFAAFGGTVEGAGTCLYPSNQFVITQACTLANPGFSLNGSGQIMVNGRCLEAPSSGTGAAFLDTCTSSVFQQWAFRAATLFNQGTYNCLQTTDGTNPAAMGACWNNLWMPIGFPMLLEFWDNGNPSTYCVEDSESNYNLGPSTSLSFCSVFDQEEWQYNLFGNYYQPSSALVGVADGYALDVYADYVNPSGVGTVDMATPNGTNAQEWIFTVSSQTPAGAVTLASGADHFGGGRHDTVCLDLQNDYVNIFTPFDVYYCNSQYGYFSNPAQLFVPLIVGFPH